MKNLILIVLIPIHISLFTIQLLSQPCLPEGITFTTQEEIDNFQTNYPNCTEIEGNVEIYGSNISNLNGLNVLTSFGGGFMIGYTSLTSFIGLENLTTIGGNLEISYNDALSSLVGLENITYIEGEVYIGIWSFFGGIGNSSLISLTGLNNLNSIGGGLFIIYNDALTSLAGLDNLDSIGGYLWIESNDALTGLSDINNLTHIGGGLYIHTNYALSSLTGLGSVTSLGSDLIVFSNNALASLMGLQGLISIGGIIEISYNDALTDLSGLENLYSLSGFLWIGYNAALTSLVGIDNIDATSISGLYIRNNNSLATCEVQSVCDYLANPGGIVEIHDNAPGCYNQGEVISACEAVSVGELIAIEKFTISPNPLESSTIIEYSLHQNSHVTIKILDLNGRVILTLVDEFQSPGDQTVHFIGNGLKHGIYFCLLKTNDGIQITKMIKI